MAIGCEDVSARMMDLLYGEVPADERATLEAHVTGCARCRAELAAFQATRAAARRSLDADAPPARAHQAIMRAAAAAVAAKEAQPIAARPAPARPSFWERLRLRWTLPTFATVGAVAVVVLASKVFLEPEKTVELGRRTVHPTPAAAPAVPAAAPQPVALAPGEAPVANANRGALKDEKDDIERDKAKIRAAAAERRQPPSDRAATSVGSAAERKRAASAKAFDGMGASGKGAGAFARHKGGSALDGLMGDDNLLEGGSGSSSTSTPRPSKREFAPPPPPRTEPPSAAASAGGADKRVLNDELEEKAGPAPARAGGGRLQGGSGAAAPPVHVAAKAKKASVSDDVFAQAPAANAKKSSSVADDDFARAPAASAPAPAAAPPPAAAPSPPPAAHAAQKESRRADVKTDSKPAGESPAAHADRLYAEGRWAEAARAYRELLRRDPRNTDAPRWRQRMAAAEAAIAPEAPAAATAPAR